MVLHRHGRSRAGPGANAASHLLRVSSQRPAVAGPLVYLVADCGGVCVCVDQGKVQRKGALSRNTPQIARPWPQIPCDFEGFMDALKRLRKVEDLIVVRLNRVRANYSTRAGSPCARHPTSAHKQLTRGCKTHSFTHSSFGRPAPMHSPRVRRLPL